MTIRKALTSPEEIISEVISRFWRSRCEKKMTDEKWLEMHNRRKHYHISQKKPTLAKHYFNLFPKKTL